MMLLAQVSSCMLILSSLVRAVVVSTSERKRVTERAQFRAAVAISAGGPNTTAWFGSVVVVVSLTEWRKAERDSGR